jgi:preprotein translocase subunit SecA
MLQVLDSHWKEHLAAMDYLRQGIHLRGYAQKNPKQEFKREAFEMFRAMLERIKQEVVGIIARVQFQQQAAPEAAIPRPATKPPAELSFQHEEVSALDDSAAAPDPQAPESRPAAQPYVREGRKVGRNEPCPCGSGKKYKQCHGRLS